MWPRGWVEIQLYSSTTAALEGGEWSAAPRPHFTPGKIRYPLYRRLGGPQGRSGGAKNLVPPGIRSLTVQLVAQSLYRLSYRPTIRGVKIVYSITTIINDKYQEFFVNSLCFLFLQCTKQIIPKGVRIHTRHPYQDIR